MSAPEDEARRIVETSCTCFSYHQPTERTGTKVTCSSCLLRRRVAEAIRAAEARGAERMRDAAARTAEWERDSLGCSHEGKRPFDRAIDKIRALPLTGAQEKP